MTHNRHLPEVLLLSKSVRYKWTRDVYSVVRSDVRDNVGNNNDAFLFNIRKNIY